MAAHAQAHAALAPNASGAQRLDDVTPDALLRCFQQWLRAAPPPSRAQVVKSQQMVDLKTEISNSKSRCSESWKAIKTLQSSNAIDEKIKLIEKRKLALLRNIKELKIMLDKQNMKMDENIEAIEPAIDTEIDQIKKNIRDLKIKGTTRHQEIKSQIHFFKECEENLKICMNENTQLWEDRLNDVINEMQKTYQDMQQKHTANKYSFERRKQAMKEIEAEEEMNMVKEIEILQIEYNVLKEKVQGIQQTRAKISSELRAGIDNFRVLENQLNADAMQHDTYSMNSLALSTYAARPCALRHVRHAGHSGHGGRAAQVAHAARAVQVAHAAQAAQTAQAQAAHAHAPGHVSYSLPPSSARPRGYY